MLEDFLSFFFSFFLSFIEIFRKQSSAVHLSVLRVSNLNHVRVERKHMPLVGNIRVLRANASAVREISFSCGVRARFAIVNVRRE